MIELPALFSRTAKGGITQWTVTTDGPYVVVQVGSLEGKQVTHKSLCAPTNLGRANQRNAEQQAEFEAMAAWQKKQDREGYFADLQTAKATTVYLPMLAQKFAPAKVAFPAVISPKLNGLRLLASVDDGKVVLRSRTGVVWDIPHISDSVKIFAGSTNVMLDGEVYIHGVSLQNLNGLVKNVARPERLGLQYHLYDLPLYNGQSEIWDKRWEQLNALHHAYESHAVGNVIQLVTQRVVNNWEELKAFEASAILAGYEGAVLRSFGAPYGFNSRPKCMMKIKNFQDGSFEVIDMKSRVYSVNGREETICDICICRNDLNAKTFEVVPRGSVDQRAVYWKDRENYIGKYLLVRYLERSDDSLPSGNPVGIAFRLEDDGAIEDATATAWD